MTNDLTAARRELLARRLRARGLTARPAGDAAPAADRTALSAAQRRMWFGQRRDPAGTELNIPFAHRLTGPLDADRLLGALHAVVDRHPALRTAIDDEGGTPRLSVRAARVEWQRTDLGELTGDACDRRVAVLARRDADRPFDLARDPLLRAHLIRTGPDAHVLSLVVHHIAFDDASFPLFWDDLAAAYAGRELPPNPPPAGEAAVDPARVAAAARALRPLPDPVPLPGDTGIDLGPAAARVSLPAGLDTAITAAARAAGVTPFTWFLAAHAVAVARLFGADDAAVSVPVTARPAGTEAAIGYFGNIAVRRLTTRPGDTFGALATRLQADGAAHLALADVPIDAVIGALDPARGGGAATGADGFTRLVQLSFTTRTAGPGPRLGGVTAAPVDLATPGAQVPFEVSVIRAAAPPASGDPAPARTEVEVRYRRGRVAPDAVDAYLAALPVLLAGTVAAPDADLRRLPLTTAEHRAELITAGRGTVVPDTYPGTLAGLWAAAVRHDPDAPAVVTDETVVSYRELDDRAAALATELTGRGVRAGDVVALELAASPEFLIAALAVVRLGAAYLPVDPAYPAERRRLLLDDARPRLVLDTDAVRHINTGTAGTAPTATPGDPAYVIYTSGSTGRPKGVLVGNAAIAEHLAGHLAAGSLTPADRVLLTSSVSFDASVFEMFATLTAGATLVIGRPGGAADFGYVSDLVDRHRVTVVHMVPSTLATYLMLPGVARWRGVRWIPVGGEALPGGVADRARAVLGARVTNNYGPTEAVVAATGRAVDEPMGGTTVPIGGPTPGTAVYVLDAALAPVPDGIAGELYLGGEQLAAGYLGDPARTAGRFVADPWRSGRRMYRTGDLVRRVPAAGHPADLEFLGRTDEQVKIHGFRIEPGEVAAVLSGLDGVGQAAVVAVDDPATGRYLAAYLAPADVDTTAVAAAAARELPAHLVPAAYVTLGALPIGPNGKLARAALPAVRRDGGPRGDRIGAGRAPGTATERAVAAAFARLLDRPEAEIATGDSFFTLGGHSLLVTRLVAQLRAESGAELGVRTVFDGPTVAQVAAAVDAGGDGGTRLPGVTRRTELPAVLPLTASQRSIRFAAAMGGAAAETSGAAVIEAAVVLRGTPASPGTVDVPALTAALADVVARRDALRTVIEPDGAGARVLDRWTPELPVTAADPETARRELLARPFPLTGAPLLRAQLIDCGNEHVLQLAVHHLVTDHRSMELLLDDLFRAYRARRTGTDPGFDDAPRFADHAVWQAEVFGSEAGRAAVDAVAAALRDLPAQIPARHDHPRRAESAFARGHRAGFRIEPALRARLREVAQRHGATEFVLAQAALAVLLHRHAGGRDIAVGTPAAGRTEPAVDETVGVLANMVVLRTAVRPDATLADVLEGSRAAAARAFDGQTVPFELVVDAAAPDRAPGRNPLFQTVLHVRDDAAVLAPRPVDAGLTATRLPMDFDVALVDLAVSLFGTADGGFDGGVIAGPTVYAADTAGRLADAMARVLRAFAEPATRVADVLPELAVLAAPLPALEPATPAPGAGSPGSAPADALALLTGILEELLGVPGITGDDNYFAVGGDSVTSLQFAARAAAAGVPITPQQVFEAPTIGDLVAAAESAAPGASAPPDPGASAPPDSGASAPPDSGASAPPDSRTSAPGPVPAPSAAMSASGLDADQLAALTSAWKAR